MDSIQTSLRLPLLGFWQPGNLGTPDPSIPTLPLEVTVTTTLAFIPESMALSPMFNLGSGMGQ